MFDRRFWQILVVVLSAIGGAAACGRAGGQDFEDDDELPFGLIAQYADHHGRRAQRVDHALAFNWSAHAVDPRLGPGPFAATWRGLLMSQLNGEYRLHAHFSGTLKVALRDRVVLQAQHEHAQWSDGPSVALEFDWHPLTVEYQSPPDGRGRLQLFWSGPGFGLEPVSPHLYHAAEESPNDSFTHGEALTRALRCGACHELSAQPEALAAPALIPGRGAWNASWLRQWLSEAHDQDPHRRRMPWLALSASDVDALVACLAAPPRPPVADGQQEPDGEQEPDEPPTPAESAADDQADDQAANGDVEAGEYLFLSQGCLACHRWRNLGEESLFSGGDLSAIADKRPVDFLRTWLQEPERWNPAHRMPKFDLSGKQRDQLAAFLAEQGDEIGAAQTLDEQARDHAPGRLAPPPNTLHVNSSYVNIRSNDILHVNYLREDPQHAEARRTLAESGGQLLRQLACHACHPTPAAGAGAAAKRPWRAGPDWSRSCLEDSPSTDARPRYRLDETSSEAVKAYWNGLPAQAPAAWSGEQVMRERQCLACHARGRFSGAEPRLIGLLREKPDLARVAPLLKPPSLNSVGDKLHEPALLQAMAGGNPRRTWLQTQMPKYSLSQAEQTMLVQHFLAEDRIPSREDATPLELSSDPTVLATGRRLVTADGFGCTSCHPVGAVKPPSAALNAQGPDLAQLDQRIRRSWYERWVRDPARIVPRMEMPSLKLAVSGVLGDDLDQQISAVWTVLNEPGFAPPEPSPVRVLRRSGVLEAQEPSIIATDVLRVDGHRYVKPMLLALANRHNFLFDLQRGRLARWWLGDAARQRTQGKTWYWESDGENLLRRDVADQPDLVVRGADSAPLPTARRGQFVTSIDSARHDGSSVSWSYRLHYAAATELPVVLRVQETWIPLGADVVTAGGAERRLRIAGMPASMELELRLADASNASAAWSGHRLFLDPRRATWVEVENGHGEGRALDDGRWSWRPGAQGAASDDVELRLRYLTHYPADIFPSASPAGPPAGPPAGLIRPLSNTPGFRGARLPIGDQIMPTGLAWRPSGELLATSLKGRVWRLTDSDGDGIEDAAQAFSDELAAPYGIFAAADYVDVINKFALLRLHDRDHDGWAEQWETLASGWGHTDDYHDWTVGLPREPDGSYIVATACQQDDRSPEAARLRGRVLRLKPRQPTLDDPERFEIETISQGHRFPMGLARNRQAELFVTDNQGNYNPFNELNHVQPGLRYGFVNTLERRSGFNPSLTAPAINIPHPWTRSVNGVCFLETPDSIRSTQGPRFGAWEGHLVGCEYDSRRLIRMSLQRVGEVLQGAAYPLSYYHPGDDQVFLGPLVCAVSPDAKLYVGGIRDSGWGGANNIGEIVQLTPELEQAPPGIAEMRVTPDGFQLLFNQPVEHARATDLSNYHLASFRREATPEYGGPDLDRRRETIASVEIANDHLAARLRLSELREGYVYELRVKSLVGDGEFFPAEAFYTLNRVPAASEPPPGF